MVIAKPEAETENKEVETVLLLDSDALIVECIEQDIDGAIREKYIRGEDLEIPIYEDLTAAIQARITEIYENAGWSIRFDKHDEHEPPFALYSVILS